MQNLGLTTSEKAFLQGRVEALHRLLNPEAPMNRWMKAPPGLTPGLAGIDPALLVVPPAGLEVGYVPITLYEGLQKPSESCVPPPPAPPQPPSPPSPPPTPPPRPPPLPSPPWGKAGIYASCLAACDKQGYCADNPSGGEFCWMVTSCSYGCLLASKASSLAQCLQWCTASNQPGCTYTAPYSGAKAYGKCADCPGCGSPVNR